MQELVKYMENNGFRYTTDYEMSTVYFDKIIAGELWYFALTEPHDGNDYKWMLRAENSKDFDRWGNATFEEFYNSKDDFIKSALSNINLAVK